jgi:NAD(P)-dependent dehydrogenase (short-subunit alcohol dehydrogenase family)
MEQVIQAKPFDLTDRIAVVTGGGRGIGRELALGLASQGVDVAVIVDRNTEEAEEVAGFIRDLGRRSLALIADVSKKDQVDRMVWSVSQTFGRIDILVNNAGVVARGPVTDLDEDTFDRVMAVNFKGVFLCCQAVGRIMAAQEKGCVINVASVAGERGVRERSVYAASKAAVISLTKSMALEWAPHGIRVNAIAPAYVDTPLTHPLFQEDSPYYRWILSKTPMRRVLATKELIGAIIFLASDAASAITGTVLPVDGGWLAD